jgi:hypothetical protein
MANLNVIKGDSSLVHKITVTGYADISSANWAGTVTLASTLGGTPIVSRAIDKAADNSGFLGYLRPSETVGLVVDETYSLTYQVVNVVIVPQLTREIQHSIKILRSGA